mgnify:CR=1 FL=1
MIFCQDLEKRQAETEKKREKIVSERKQETKEQARKAELERLKSRTGGAKATDDSYI